MKRLAAMTSAELVEEARKRAAAAREDNRKLGEVLAELLDWVDEVSRRIDDDGG